MLFRIADTFTDSLTKLTGQEQKAVKTTAFDLQMNPANPGLRFHKLEKAKDENFWSVSVNMDIRLIVHKTDQSLLLCYVDHHDKAYEWASRRKLETHPTTGAAQLVEIRETVKEITIPVYKEQETAPVVYPHAKPKLFAGVAEEALLSYGVPQDWLADVKAADEDTILDIAAYLPDEAADAVLAIACGGTPRIPPILQSGANPFDHPDAKRRFRVMHNVEELELALEYPWEKWAIFLHPDQEELVEKQFSGPARVTGSAGTGKTVVAMHRARHLARSHPESRVLLATFSSILANSLRDKLKHLLSKELRLGERLEVYSLKEIAIRQYTANFGKPVLASADQVKAILKSVSDQQNSNFSQRFLFNEWFHVVDAWQIKGWEAYRDVKRLGRKTRLNEEKRQELWAIFHQLEKQLSSEGVITESEMYARLAAKFSETDRAIFDFVVIDEAQDLSVPQLQFIASIGKNRPDSLFFAGDLGQRIFQQPFSWKQLGIDIRGRSTTLRINYRTSHQIRQQADLLLNLEITDGDGNTESRKGTISVFNGPNPALEIAEDEATEADIVAKHLNRFIEDGIEPHEIGVFVRSENEIERGRAAIEKASLSVNALNYRMESLVNSVALSTMHFAKGLEFKAVVVMACDEGIVPLAERLDSVADDPVELQEAYESERHLLYVACTRARDHLVVTCTDPGSEYLDDFQMS